MLQRFLAAAGLAVAVLCTPVSAAAAVSAQPTPPPPMECSDPGFNCTYDGTQWNVDSPDSTTSYYGDPIGTDNGPSPGAMFGLFFVLALVVGGVGLYWRVSAARRIAEQAGIDPDSAASTALLTHDGLAATYIAANIRQLNADRDEPRVAPAPVLTRTPERRLADLKQLRDEGLITEDEYTSRRTAILDTV